MTQADDWTRRFARMAQDEDEVVALRAENERLVASFDDQVAETERFTQALADCQRSEDALRAENAMLRLDVISLAKGYEDRILELHADVERLRADLKLGQEFSRSEIANRDTENDRLRAALAEITDLN